VRAFDGGDRYFAVFSFQIVDSEQRTETNARDVELAEVMGVAGETS